MSRIKKFPCPNCNGTGKVFEKHDGVLRSLVCAKCGGTGVDQKQAVHAMNTGDGVLSDKEPSKAKLTKLLEEYIPNRLYREHPLIASEVSNGSLLRRLSTYEQLMAQRDVVTYYKFIENFLLKLKMGKLPKNSYFLGVPSEDFSLLSFLYTVMRYVLMNGYSSTHLLDIQTIYSLLDSGSYEDLDAEFKGADIIIGLVPISYSNVNNNVISISYLVSKARELGKPLLLGSYVSSTGLMGLTSKGNKNRGRVSTSSRFALDLMSSFTHNSHDYDFGKLMLVEIGSDSRVIYRNGLVDFLGEYSEFSSINKFKQQGYQRYQHYTQEHSESTGGFSIEGNVPSVLSHKQKQQQQNIGKLPNKPVKQDKGTVNKGSKQSYTKKVAPKEGKTKDEANLYDSDFWKNNYQ